MRIPRFEWPRSVLHGRAFWQDTFGQVVQPRTDGPHLEQPCLSLKSFHGQSGHTVAGHGEVSAWGVGS